MAYKRLILGDANIVRSWQAAQLARPKDLVGASLKSATCLDTLSASLESVSDEVDYVVVSVMTGLLLEDVSPSDLKGSSVNILEGVVRRVCSTAKRTSRVQVCAICLY